MNLEIPFSDLETPTPVQASAYLDTLGKNMISNAPWTAFNYKPEVSFAISYTADSILLKYYVREDCFKAIYNVNNDPVYRDSCVEFFISLDNDNNYYNLEFNALGTCLAGYGNVKPERKSLSDQVINKIMYHKLLQVNSPEKGIYWELTVIIPFELFQYHSVSTLKNKACNANFYKCGDDLPRPHFLAWNNITSTEPNFHLPEFFGQVKFI